MGDRPLGTFPNWTEAEMFVQVLRAEGIPAALIPLAPFDGWGSSAWSAHEIRVAERDFVQAAALFQEWQEGAGDVVLPGD